MKKFMKSWLKNLVIIMFIILTSMAILCVAFLVHLAFIHSSLLGGIILLLMISLPMTIWE